MTENAWPPDTNRHPNVAIPLDQCDLVTIPGTNGLKLWFQRGIPAIILSAFLADLNAFVESAANARGYADEGSWTPSNSVGTSNHLGATAFDFNWADHPMGNALAGWGGSEIIRGPEEPAVRDLLSWYTFGGVQLVWWGNDWNSPKDSMHFQMGYGTFEDQDKCWRFIDSHIRADGFSTYRRGGVPRGGGPAVPVATPSAADVLARATGLSLGLASEILPTVTSGLKAAECVNANRIAMWLAQCGEESAGFATAEEYASGAEYEGRCSDLGNCSPGDGVKYKGRTWIQITGKAHYREFSQWAAGKGFVASPTQFVDDPASLGDLQWAGIGAAWYWTVSRPDINTLSDQGDVVGVTQRINGGQNGIADRSSRYNRAIAIGDQLLQLINPATELDEWEQLMADPTQDSSRSCYRNSNDKTMTARDAVFGADATSHMNWVEQAAMRGEQWAIGAVATTARGQGAGATQWNDPTQVDQWAVGHAQAVLAYIEAVNPAALKAYLGKAAA